MIVGVVGMAIVILGGSAVVLRKPKTSKPASAKAKK
jgi:hypothetical protein